MEIPELRPRRLGYVALGVANIEESVRFWTEAVQLDVSERTADRVYLRGGMQHHWIALRQSRDPGLERLGIEVDDRATLDAFEQRLRQAGVAVETGEGLDTDRVDRYLRFADPAGNPLELYTDMVSMPTPPRPVNVTLLEIQHVVLAVGDTREAHDFYTGVLGMRVSDWVGRDVCFTHFANGWHHGIGLSRMPNASHGLNHICFQPPDLDNVMRARARVRKLGLTITMDILRHAPSGSVGFYFVGPDTICEMSFGARQFAPDEVFKPRLLAAGQDTLDVWQAGLVDVEQSVVQSLAEMAGRKQAGRGGG